MEGKTYVYIITINLAVLLLWTAPVRAQNAPTNPENSDEVVFPFYNGLSVGVDIFGIGSKLLGGDFLSTEVSVQANLKNRFLPIAEIGFGSTDSWSERGTHYKSSAPYFKLGLNYNTMYKKNNKGFLYVGLRYAFSSVSYDINTAEITDPIWGSSGGSPTLDDEIWGTQTPPFHRNGMKASMHWAEFLVGVQVEVFNSFHMGWSIRMKYKLTGSSDQYGDPWYIPGFGTYGSSTIGLTYSLIYKLPF